VDGSPHVALRNDGFRGYADHMETDEFAAGLDHLTDIAGRQAVAIMCAESVWWRCHRRLTSDALVLVRGVPVQHLLHDGRVAEHRPSSEARVDGDRRRLVYDVGVLLS
jgi:uncharacterized protein (DUF488 family)